eukprot:3611806-Alexandrium_andersonii.AAC.1
MADAPEPRRLVTKASPRSASLTTCWKKSCWAKEARMITHPEVRHPRPRTGPWRCRGRISR